MAVHLYPVSPEHDYPRLAELINRMTDRQVSAELLRELDAGGPAGRIRWQVVAVEDGRIVGFADTGRDPDMEQGRFGLTLAVEPERRGRGIGAMLLEDALAFAWEQGATTLTFELASVDGEAIRFAERHGFMPVEPRGPDADAPAEHAGTRLAHVYALSLDGRGMIPPDQAELFDLIRRLSHELPDVASVTLTCDAPCPPACGDLDDESPDSCLDMGASLWQRMLCLPRVG